MSSRNKLQKFAEVLAMPHVYENFDPDHPVLTRREGETIDMKGRWNELHFKNESSIVLELACGRGEYSLALARSHPEKNFIGVDIKGARIWKGAKIAQKENLDNVAFVRTRIEQIGQFFAPSEVAEIWITFPDPFLRKSKSNRRLTSHPFLERYISILQPGATVHLKTDNTPLYDFSLDCFSENENYIITYHNDDIYSGELPFPELEHKTYYEKQHLDNGLTIKYIRASYIGKSAAIKQ